MLGPLSRPPDRESRTPQAPWLPASAPAPGSDLSAAARQVCAPASGRTWTGAGFRAVLSTPLGASLRGFARRVFSRAEPGILWNRHRERRPPGPQRLRGAGHGGAVRAGRLRVRGWVLPGRRGRQVGTGGDGRRPLCPKEPPAPCSWGRSSSYQFTGPYGAAAKRRAWRVALSPSSGQGGASPLMLGCVRETP